MAQGGGHPGQRTGGPGGGQGGRQGGAATAEQGVLFPLGPDGRRSTASTGKAVWADAVRGVDDVLGARIGQAGDWRKDYVRAVVSHTGAATRSPDAAVTVARQGLASLATRMRFERDGAGRVVRLVAGQDRVWAMPFTRAGPASAAPPAAHVR